MMKTINKIREITGQVSQKHVGAYAAQSAYFFVLSMIPIILLLLAIIQYTPVTKADVMTAVVNLFPETNMQDFMVGIVNEVYNQSKTVIPITAIVALWSAGKGVLAVSTGLNCAFIAAIVMALVLSVFGNNISIFIYHKIPFLAETTDMIMRLRTVISFVVMTGISLLVYHFLPNRKLPFRDLILGSIFCSLGWLVISFVFSMYLTIFKGFSGLYGSMTAIILVMLWLYFCMYVMLLGGLINCIWVDAKRDILEKD